MSIVNELKKHLKREKVSFHMPGHKSGRLLNKSCLKSNVWKFDTTELDGTDCLQNPQEFLKKAEEKAAKIYGAKESFFLVNGATCGILAMFFACFKDGNKVIVSRDCHKSVINAITFSGVIPIYVSPDVNESGISLGASVTEIEKALEQNPDSKGVFITSPTYYGVVSDIEKISEITHRYGALLLCDEAHGAHFEFSEEFPKGAVKKGADISVVSLHKTMPSPNQTAILNLGKCKIDRAQMQKAINMFQTTSPSYIFMCAMEEALDFGMKNGDKLTNKIIRNIPKSRYIKRFDDPFKIVLDFSCKGYSGNEVSEILQEKFGIYPEMAQGKYVLLILSWGNTKKDFLHLKKAIKYIESLPDKSKEIITASKLAFNNIIQLSPKEVRERETEFVKISEAEGKTAASEITSFPPCIPILLPGEKIEKHHIDLINEKIKEKANILNIKEDYVSVIKDC